MHNYFYKRAERKYFTVKAQNDENIFLSLPVADQHQWLHDYLTGRKAVKTHFTLFWRLRMDYNPQLAGSDVTIPCAVN